MTKWIINVPGSTANLGPGFDSIGLAINRYIKLEITPSEVWEFIYDTPGYEEVPKDKENLIYKACAFTLRQLGINEDSRACKVYIESELPLARGLGSSAAAIVAGIEIANLLYDLSLDKETKVRLSSLYEGHPDNAAASVYGGLTIGTHNEEETLVIPCGNIDLELIILVPEQQLLTSSSRDVLPKRLEYRDAIQGSSIANVFVAALLRGDYHTAGKMMTKDLFHQPYRAEIVPHLNDIIAYVNESKHIYGAALSGAGPAIMCFVEPGMADNIISKMEKIFSNYDYEKLLLDMNGVTVQAN